MSVNPSRFIENYLSLAQTFISQVHLHYDLQSQRSLSTNNFLSPHHRISLSSLVTAQSASFLAA